VLTLAQLQLHLHRLDRRLDRAQRRLDWLRTKLAQLAGLVAARVEWERRPARQYPPRRPPLTVEQILTWADAHRERTGAWPIILSGPIAAASGESWVNVNQALEHGYRGLPGGSSLSRLLLEHRGGAPGTRRQLTYGLVLTWCDAWLDRTGAYPTATRKEVPEAPGLTWQVLDQALAQGSHGLPGGTTLARLLHARRGIPPRPSGPGGRRPVNHRWQRKG
jgi:hypothetical protein